MLNPQEADPHAASAPSPKLPEISETQKPASLDTSINAPSKALERSGNLFRWFDVKDPMFQFVRTEPDAAAFKRFEDAYPELARAASKAMAALRAWEVEVHFPRVIFIPEAEGSPAEEFERYAPLLRERTEKMRREVFPILNQVHDVLPKFGISPREYGGDAEDHD